MAFSSIERSPSLSSEEEPTLSDHSPSPPLNGSEEDSESYETPEPNLPDPDPDPGLRDSPEPRPPDPGPGPDPGLWVSQNFPYFPDPTHDLFSEDDREEEKERWKWTKRILEMLTMFIWFILLDMGLLILFNEFYCCAQDETWDLCPPLELCLEMYMTPGIRGPG